MSKLAEPETWGHPSCWPIAEVGRHAQAWVMGLLALLAHPSSQSPARQHLPSQPRGF